MKYKNYKEKYNKLKKIYKIINLTDFNISLLENHYKLNDTLIDNIICAYNINIEDLYTLDDTDEEEENVNEEQNNDKEEQNNDKEENINEEQIMIKKKILMKNK
jgi:hypothetical protein